MLTRVILVTSWLALLALVLAAHLAAGGRLEHADAPARPQAGALPAVVTASSPEAPAQLDMRRQLARLVAAIPRDSRYGTATATQLARELSGARPFLLDVREPAERQTDGYVEGSVSIPLRRLMASLDQLPARDRAIVVYCASSHRGAMAMTALRLLGYTNVRNLAFGFGAWWKAGLPVAEDSAPAGPAVGTAPAIESPALHRMLGEYFAQMPSDFHATTAAALHADLSAGKRLVLVDVRRPEQYDKDGHIAGAVSVPFEVLFDNLDRLPPRDTPTLVYCASGHRSAVAVMGLCLLGYTDATSLDGGVDAWRAAGLPLGAGGAR
jgi:rhodanese-related sulfurtransferase